MQTLAQLLFSILSGTLVACVAVTADPPLALNAATGNDLADQAVSLMRRVLEIPLPERLAPELARRVPAHVVTDYERGTSVYEGVGFFEPFLIRASDRKLFRDLQRYWKRSSAEKLRSLGRLADYYRSESDPLRGMVAQLVSEIALDGFDVENWEATAEPVLLELLEDSSEPKHTEEMLRPLLRGDFRLSVDGYHRLMQLADRWATSTKLWPRVELVRVIASPAMGRNPPDEVAEYLLALVASDAPDDVRAWAVEDWVVRRHGEERVLPVYLDALAGGSSDSRALVLGLIKVVGSHRRMPEAVPALIAILDSTDHMAVQHAISALEKITKLGPDQLGYRKELDRGLMLPQVNPDNYDPRVLNAVRRVAEIWREWWRRNRVEFERIIESRSDNG